MTPLDLAAIEKAAKEATEGPWVRSNFGTQVLTGDSWSTICVFWEHTGDRSKTHNDAHWQHGPGPASPEANATFIALANPATILALCERIRELEAGLLPFADVDGEGDEDFPDSTSVVVQFGRTTYFPLRLGDFRKARALITETDNG